MIAWYVMAPGGLQLNGGATFLHRMTRTTHLREYAYGGQARISGSPRRFALPPSDQTIAPCEAGRANRLGEPQSPNNKTIRQSRNKLQAYSLRVFFETIREAFILLFVAWAFVNGVNSMRVVLSYWTRLASEALLPERFDGAVHMVSGVMIFFPALLAAWWVCKTKTSEVLHERES
jgi:exosortase/archaeosortase family protein